MSKTHYELRPGVNSVRIGSLVIDEHGHTANSPAEQALLEAHPDIVQAKAEKPAAKETT